MTTEPETPCSYGVHVMCASTCSCPCHDDEGEQ